MNLHAVRFGRLNLVVQKGVDNGIFADAQRGVVRVGLQLGEVGGSLAAAAALQQGLHGVQVVGNVVAHTADALVLGGQVGVVLLLGLHLQGQLRIFRLELGPLSDVADGEKEAHIGDDGGRDGDTEENDPALVRRSPDRVQPAEHEKVLADREDGEQQPVPAAQINFDPVDQQAVKEEQHGAGGQIRPPK